MTPEVDVTWVDSGREPECAPDPLFPVGRDIDMSKGGETCLVELPYPSPRCGHYVIVCRTCGQRVVVTTAGRPDDPRTVKLGCWTHQVRQ